MADQENDLLVLIDHDNSPELPPAPPWRILVVDDDAEVHQVTHLALGEVRILNRPLELIDALSAAETLRLLETDRDFAVIVLDVVMETADAGLKLVSAIRDRFLMRDVRIILRTGQPGYAPEIDVFARYDINDYHSKTELTHARLITAMTSALRAYEQICGNVENREAMERIAQVSAGLNEQHTLDALAQSTLLSIQQVLKCKVEGFFAAQRSSSESEQSEETPESAGADTALWVMAATSAYCQYRNQTIERLDAAEQALLQSALSQAHDVFDDRQVALHLYGGFEEAIVFLCLPEAISSTQKQVLALLSANLSSAFASVKLFEKLNFAAHHDPLTGLSNRQRFIQLLDEVAVSPAKDMTIALIDINHFADLNDGLGQEVGDALLVSIGQRLQAVAADQGVIARVGADIFGIAGPADLVNPPNIFRLFDTPYTVEDNQLLVSVTVGLCRVAEGGDTGIRLLKSANIALNRAKKSMVAHYEYFSHDMEDNTRWRLEIIRELRRDFDQEKLDVWFQPQVHLHTGAVTGIEALIRWPNDHGGFVHPPNVFIPLAEYSGLIVDIGQWVLERAAAALLQLHAQGIAPSRVAVNVSMPQFRSHNFVRDVAEVISCCGLPATSLELEITESIAMDEPKVVQNSFHALKELGTRIAIDDFGTGYSSLGHLRALPIDAIKIDQMFVREISGGRGGMFAETIVALSKRLGIETIAEGVETREQAEFLQALGCTEGQGWLYAKPMPLPQLEAWLRQLATRP